MYDYIPDNPYILLTPGPLSTSKGVRAALLRDWCTWDADYNEDIVQNIRRRLVAIATKDTDNYTAVLMQGSGSFAVEACLGTALPKDGKLLILTNGAYGNRMAEMAKVLNIDHTVADLGEVTAPTAEDLKTILKNDPTLTHVAFVHCET
ncbi:MAG: 2-aminoethylphosphonate--pyruvate transaminase, partial [Defluviitaleaceae bacterium]|nr:2-aminoethylphosphonate--pyruvate transaminase [Defluviitaleaceae bacterium]